MKKIVSLIIAILVMSITMAAFAASKDAEPKLTFAQSIQAITAQQNADPKAAEMPAVAIMYINNAKTTYDYELDQAMLNNLTRCLNTNTYYYVDGSPYLQYLHQQGIGDITAAERADIIDAFADSGIDYAIFMQLEPFFRKETITVFTQGKQMTATVPFKIIDLKNNKYIYNGKFTELAKDSTIIGDVGNKSVSLKALEKVNAKIANIILERMPVAK